jgi:AAA+ superfamily predicted ATPase
MRFYKIKAKVDDRFLVSLGTEDDSRKQLREFEDHVGAYAKAVCLTDESIRDESFGADCHINFSAIDKAKAVLAMVIERDDKKMEHIRALVEDYLRAQDYDGEIQRIEECTGRTYRNLIFDADRSGFIDDYDEMLERYEMNIIKGRRFQGFSFEEFLVEDEKPCKKKALGLARKAIFFPCLASEIERIYAVKQAMWTPGNPVHYAFAADEGAALTDAFRLLVKALYACGRVNGRRFTQIDYESICDYFSDEKLNEIYRLQTGGVVAIKIRKETAREGAYLAGSESRIAEVCRVATEWKTRVLTVFLFPRNSDATREEFFAKIDGMSFITISERLLFDSEAKDSISALAKENKIRNRQEICTLSKLIEPNTGYSRKDIRRIFDRWHDTYLRKAVFPQYADAGHSYNISENGSVGCALKKLQGLIGLAETKELIANILDFAKAQELFAADGARKKQSLHMVFTGNPGTAKTTVARLVAQILKENDVLRNGALIEVGRADLVGKYVGHTAPCVRSAFKKSEGSVLFIDEAYSLVDDRDGMYGDEAITTIVQEMENRRDDVVVIFAGYPDKMEKFLSKNPGLRSRIGFHVNFPDYTPKELYGILELHASEDGIRLSDDVRNRVFPFIERAAAIPEFGNGRYVRNLLEKAKMRQATRIMRMDATNVTEQTFKTLIAEDFEAIRLACSAEAFQRIGFV